MERIAEDGSKVMAADEVVASLGVEEWANRMVPFITNNGLPEDYRIPTPADVVTVSQGKGSAVGARMESRRAVRARQYGPGL